MDDSTRTDRWVRCPSCRGSVRLPAGAAATVLCPNCREPVLKFDPDTGAAWTPEPPTGGSPAGEAQQPDGWPRASEEELKPFDPVVRQFVVDGQEELITLNKLALDDILANCEIKPQFASTYRALRRDKWEMLDKLRANMNASSADGQPFQMLMIRNYDRIISYKLRLMQTHFLAKWGEDVEDWAGKETASRPGQRAPTRLSSFWAGLNGPPPKGFFLVLFGGVLAFGMLALAVAYSENRSRRDRAVTSDATTAARPAEPSFIAADVASASGLTVHRKGAFAVWREPASPKPGQDYAVTIELALPQGTGAYDRRDLSGEIIGGDGYRVSLADGREWNGKSWSRPYRPPIFRVEGNTAVVGYFVRGAHQAPVKDTVRVQSQLLGERHEFDL